MLFKHYYISISSAFTVFDALHITETIVMKEEMARVAMIEAAATQPATL